MFVPDQRACARIPLLGDAEQCVWIMIQPFVGLRLHSSILQSEPGALQTGLHSVKARTADVHTQTLTSPPDMSQPMSLAVSSDLRHLRRSGREWPDSGYFRCPDISSPESGVLASIVPSQRRVSIGRWWCFLPRGRCERYMVESPDRMCHFGGFLSLQCPVSQLRTGSSGDSCER